MGPWFEPFPTTVVSGSSCLPSALPSTPSRRDGMPARFGALESARILTQREVEADVALAERGSLGLFVLVCVTAGDHARLLAWRHAGVVAQPLHAPVRDPTPE